MVTGRYRYIVYGIVVESGFPLRAVDEAPDPTVDAAVRIDLAPPAYFQERTRDIAAVDDWLNHTVLPGGDIYMRVDGLFEAVVGSDGRQVVCARLADAEDRSFEANLLNFVLSSALVLQGEEPLHATVVDLDGRSVGLLGQGGAGKSTLAAFLITQGGKLVTDDILRLTFADGLAYAHAGPQRLKLVDGAAERLLPKAISEGYWNTLTDKIMVRPHAPMPGRHAPQPLSALFWLGDPEPPPAPGVVTATRLAGIDLARVLTASAMNIRYFAPDRLARQLQFAERVAHILPVHSLRYARSYPLLDRVAAEIRRLAVP
jgi:hypothetical protein